MEVFYVGAGTGFNPTNGSQISHPIPMLVFDNSATVITTARPLTDRIPDYCPIYGSIKAGNAATFHMLMLIFLDYLSGLTTDIDTSVKLQYEVHLNDEDITTHRKSASWTFLGTVFTIYGPRLVA
jgi:hypothetical protein